MKSISMSMNTEDKSFFGISAFLGTITEFKNIVNASIISENFAQSLVSAASIAFISGFVGLFAKKLGEFIYEKVRCKPEN